MLEKINKHIFITGVILIGVILLFAFTHLDMEIQDYFYNSSTQKWLLNRDDALLEFIFYDGIKKLLILFFVTLLFVLIIFREKPLIVEYRKGLNILLLSGMLVPLVIGGLKDISNTPCPKSIIHYNGTYPDVRVFDKYPADFPHNKKIKCWPAGHASGGFSLLALFFLFKKMSNKIKGIILALTLGWTIGLYKMLIGDHFFSHTLITMIIAWLIVLIIAKFIHKSKWRYI